MLVDFVVGIEDLPVARLTPRARMSSTREDDEAQVEESFTVDEAKTFRHRTRTRPLRRRGQRNLRCRRALDPTRQTAQNAHAKTCRTESRAIAWDEAAQIAQARQRLFRLITLS